jgi:PAS domain S-box-containing protein
MPAVESPPLTALARLPAIVIRVDPRYTVTACEGSGLAAIGLAPGAGVGSPLAELEADLDPPGVLYAACARALAGEPVRLRARWRANWFVVFVNPGDEGAEVVAIDAPEPELVGIPAASLVRMLNQIDGMLYRCRVDEAWTMELVTDGCLPITGYSADQLLMNREVAFGDLVVAEDQGWLWEKCNRNLAARRVCSNQYRIRHADGSVRWVWDRAHGVYDEQGTMLFVEGLITDVTAEHDRASERERMDEHARHVQRLESIGQLAGGVAHDFNNMLQAIHGHAQLLRSAIPAGSTLLEDLDAIDGAALRATELTSQLLTFGRRQPMKTTVVDLNGVIETQVRMLRRVFPEAIVIDFIPGRRLPLVDVDVTQIQQVLINLCLNARDAMSEGGRLTLETETVVVNGEYRQAHPWARPGRYVLLSVVDSGKGIPPDVLPRIFEPFFTTKAQGKGTGLGLAMVYGIVRTHDGMIHVYSEPGVGTTFKIYLPASERAAETVGTKLDTIPPPGCERVLVVEDEPAVRRLVGRILQGAGYQVREVADGDAALAAVSGGERVDLAVIDAVMPGLSGVETLARLRELVPGLKALLSTGHSRDLVGRAADDRDVLLKPYSPDQLLLAVRRILDQR